MNNNKCSFNKEYSNSLHTHIPSEIVMWHFTDIYTDRFFDLRWIPVSNWSSRDLIKFNNSRVVDNVWSSSRACSQLPVPFGTPECLSDLANLMLVFPLVKSVHGSCNCRNDRGSLARCRVVSFGTCIDEQFGTSINAHTAILWFLSCFVKKGLPPEDEHCILSCVSFERSSVACMRICCSALDSCAAGAPQRKNTRAKSVANESTHECIWGGYG